MYVYQTALSEYCPDFGFHPACDLVCLYKSQIAVHLYMYVYGNVVSNFAGSESMEPVDTGYSAYNLLQDRYLILRQRTFKKFIDGRLDYVIAGFDDKYTYRYSRYRVKYPPVSAQSHCASDAG